MFRTSCKQDIAAPAQHIRETWFHACLSVEVALCQLCMLSSRIAMNCHGLKVSCQQQPMLQPMLLQWASHKASKKDATRPSPHIPKAQVSKLQTQQKHTLNELKPLTQPQTPHFEPNLESLLIQKFVLHPCFEHLSLIERFWIKRALLLHNILNEQVLRLSGLQESR